MNDDDPDEDRDGNYGSCDNCGSDLTADDYGELCWWLTQANQE